MAKLINISGVTEERMTAGEKRVASRLEAFMSNECLVWYFLKSRTGPFTRCIR